MTRYGKVKTFVLAGVLCTLAHTASAALISNISLNTAPLVGHPAGPFSIFLVFTDGDGIGDGNNTVTISNVTFGGGSALGNSWSSEVQAAPSPPVSRLPIAHFSICSASRSRRECRWISR